jgi:hypothetical protein
VSLDETGETEGPSPVARRMRATYAFAGATTELALQPDRVWDVPRAAIRDVRRLDGAVRISWSDDAGGNAGISLTRWTGRPALDTPLGDVDAVEHVLISWLDPR